MILSALLGLFWGKIKSLVFIFTASLLQFQDSSQNEKGGSFQNRPSAEEVDSMGLYYRKQGSSEAPP